MLLPQLQPLRRPGAPAARTRRVRLAGRDGAAPRDAALHVADAGVPAVLRRDGWFAHAARFPADAQAGGAAGASAVALGAAPAPDVVIPSDPSLTRAAPRRVAAYLAGRYCAACALAAAAGVPAGDVGGPVAALPVGEAGAPAWPAGLVGSITHAPTRAVAVVARAGRWRALGVDCEPVLPADQADEVVALTLPEADDVEVAGGAAGGALARPELVTVGFSAKEALYKALRPLVGAFFDFSAARLTQLTHVDPAAGRARLVLAGDLAPGFARGAAFDAHFALADGHVYTCLALPRAAVPGGGGPAAPERAP